MINVNGREYKNWDEAIAFMEGEREREERNNSAKRKSEMLSNSLSAAIVYANGRKHLVCALTNDVDKDKYPYAIVEKLFGRRYKFEGNEVKENYKVSPYFINHELRKFISENMNEHFNGQKWSNVKIGSDDFTFVCLHNFLPNDTSKEDDNSDDDFDYMNSLSAFLSLFM